MCALIAALVAWKKGSVRKDIFFGLRTYQSYGLLVGFTVLNFSLLWTHQHSERSLQEDLMQRDQWVSPTEIQALRTHTASAQDSHSKLWCAEGKAGPFLLLSSGTSLGFGIVSTCWMDDVKLNVLIPACVRTLRIKKSWALSWCTLARNILRTALNQEVWNHCWFPCHVMPRCISRDQTWNFPVDLFRLHILCPVGKEYPLRHNFADFIMDSSFTFQTLL